MVIGRLLRNRCEKGRKLGKINYEKDLPRGIRPDYPTPASRGGSAQSAASAMSLSVLGNSAEEFWWALDRLIDRPPELFVRHSLPGEHRHAGLRDGGGGLILS